MAVEIAADLIEDENLTINQTQLAKICDELGEGLEKEELLEMI